MRVREADPCRDRRRRRRESWRVHGSSPRRCRAEGKIEFPAEDVGRNCPRRRCVLSSSLLASNFCPAARIVDAGTHRVRREAPCTCEIAAAETSAVGDCRRPRLQKRLAVECRFSEAAKSTSYPGLLQRTAIHDHLQIFPASRRRHRTRSDGRSREGHSVFHARGKRAVRDREGPGRRLRLRRSRSAHQRVGHVARQERRRRPARRGRRSEMGGGSLRTEAGSRAAAAAQGARALCQSAPGDLLPRARGRVLSQARNRRGPRHHDRSRTDGRRLLRRTQRDHRSRQRPEARHRHPGLRHLRNRANLRVSLSISRASAATR